MTCAWAIGWLGEFGLRVLMVDTPSIPQVLAISPIVFNGITLGLVAWTFVVRAPSTTVLPSCGPGFTNPVAVNAERQSSIPGHGSLAPSSAWRLPCKGTTMITEVRPGARP